MAVWYPRVYYHIFSFYILTMITVIFERRWRRKKTLAGLREKIMALDLLLFYCRFQIPQNGEKATKNVLKTFFFSCTLEITFLWCTYSQNQRQIMEFLQYPRA